jgi:hypothetical protein
MRRVDLYTPLKLCSILVLCMLSYILTWMVSEFTRRSDLMRRYHVNCNRTYGQAASSEWMSAVSQMNARSAFAASVYARRLAYSSMEWYKEDHFNYTMQASEWDSCMNGQENCVISFGMYATSKESLSYYLRCLLFARENAEIVYPGWRVRVYHDSSIPFSDLAVARSRGVETIQVYNSDLPGKIAGMFWRFYVADDPTVDRYIIRDLDSVFSWRERAAVDEWLISKQPFHILRDAVNHATPIMGGMWGGVRGKLPFSIQETCQEYSKMAESKGGDQDFLTVKVWPEVQKFGYMFPLTFFDVATTSLYFLHQLSNPSLVPP